MESRYTFSDHIHNYAVWTAARAAQRNFTSTENIKKAIDKSGLREFSESQQCETIADFEVFHRACANELMHNLKESGISQQKATYGRAAKIIAIYLKTAVIIPLKHEILINFIHPPIDRILLTNLSRRHKTVDSTELGWTNLDETAYWKLCRKIEQAGFALNWTLEKYWHPEQEYYKSETEF